MMWYKNLKKKFRSGSLISRIFRLIFENKFIQPLFGIQLLAGIVFVGPVAMVADHPNDLAYPGLLVSDVVLEVSVEPVMTTNTQAMQNPASEYIGTSTTFRSGHAGWDLRAPLGSSIFPVDDGVVKSVVHSTHGYGRRVIVQHEDNYESLYAHMGLIEVEEGEKVNRDTKLGEVGLTGWTTGPHIHFELYKDGVPIDPKYYLDIGLVPVATQQ